VDPRTALLTAGISAIVSLTVAIITALRNKATLKAERDKLERSLQREMTTKLYDIRIEAYPKAMQITEGLRKSVIFDNHVQTTPEYFRNILSELDDWHATKAAFIISRTTLHRLYDLRDALRQKPQEKDSFSAEEIEVIWKAKGAFRASLRDDIQLLFKEEEMK